MKAYIQRNHRVIFFLSWLLLALIQAGRTELLDDEAYYWVYSKFPAWGYFDHPPMIAVLIKPGYSIFPNELGVRLFPLLLNVFSLVIIEKLISNKNPFLFYTIALSIVVLQLAGFVAVPDTPLIFFTALFFLCYRRYLESSSLLNTVLMGVSVALLFYSKYHAVLIVLFTLMSNPRLLTRYQTYLAGIFALLVFAPHIWWQYQHDWVSLRYHLLESNVRSYTPSLTTNYLIGQLLLAGPIAGFILLPAAFLYKPADKTERALKFSMIGVYIFFFLTSFRGLVEANWTSPALVSLIVLSHQYITRNRTRLAITGQKFLYRLLPLTLALVLLARIIMIADILPIDAIKKRYHAWKDWPKEMKSLTRGLPVVWSNSYQRASKYWFYSGQQAYSQNWVGERKNSFNFWPLEDSLLGKPVYFLDIYDLHRFPDSLHTPIGEVGYQLDSSFISFARVEIKCTAKKYQLHKHDSLTIQARSVMPRVYHDFIVAHPQLPSGIAVAIFNKKGWIKTIRLPVILQELLKESFSFAFNPELPRGKYFFRFTITNPHNDTHNSDKIGLMID